MERSAFDVPARSPPRRPSRRARGRRPGGDRSRPQIYGCRRRAPRAVSHGHPRHARCTRSTYAARTPRASGSGRVPRRGAVPAAARGARAARAADRGGRVPRLPAVSRCHAGGVRRGQSVGARDDRRRGARRRRGPRRRAVRRAGGAPARRGARPGRDPARRRVRHERGEALQVHAPGQAPHPRQADALRDRGVPAVARPGARAREAARSSLLLGATAAQALLGSRFRVTQSRGAPLETPFARWTFATVHPSSVLRAPDPEAREEARAAFFADLKVVGGYLRAP